MNGREYPAAPGTGLRDSAYQRLVERTRRGFVWTKDDEERLKAKVARLVKR